MKTLSSLGVLVVLVSVFAVSGACVVPSDLAGETASDRTATSMPSGGAAAEPASVSTMPLGSDESSSEPAIHPLSAVCGSCSDFVCQLRSVNAVCGTQGTRTLHCLNATETTCSQDGNPACQCIGGGIN
jgi:hypothetical protein